MSIKVNDFKWEKGKNDLEYIALLERNRDAMLDNFRKCSKVAREQYNKGKADGRAEVIDECIEEIIPTLYELDVEQSVIDIVKRWFEKLKEQKGE